MIAVKVAGLVLLCLQVSNIVLSGLANANMVFRVWSDGVCSFPILFALSSSASPNLASSQSPLRR